MAKRSTAKSAITPIAPPQFGLGELSRSVVHERERDWPDLLEVVAHFGKNRVALTITPGEYFGTYGAPMSGNQALGIIDRLRRSRAQAEEFGREQERKERLAAKRNSKGKKR